MKKVIQSIIFPSNQNIASNINIVKLKFAIRKGKQTGRVLETK